MPLQATHEMQELLKLESLLHTATKRTDYLDRRIVLVAQDADDRENMTFLSLSDTNPNWPDDQIRPRDKAIHECNAAFCVKGFNWNIKKCTVVGTIHDKEAVCG